MSRKPGPRSRLRGLGRRRLRAASVVLGTIAGVALFALMTPTALSNGDSVEIYRERGGGYEMVVGVLPERPRVGVVHVTITLLDAESGDPVSDARINVVAHDELGNARYQARAVNTPAAPRHYDANFTIESEGNWMLVVEVQSDRLNLATFNVPLSVDSPSNEPGLGGLLIWLLVIAAFVGGGVYVWYSSVRASRRAAEGG